MSSQNKPARNSVKNTATKTMVKVGMVSIPVYPMGDGRFVVKHKEDGKWKNIACKSLDAAKAKAEVVARRMQNGETRMLDLTPDEANVLARARRMGITHADLDRIEKNKAAKNDISVQDAIARYVNGKVAMRDGRKGAYMAPLEQDLKRFAEFVGDIPVHALKPNHVGSWLDEKRDGGAGPRRRLNLFKIVRGFLLWCGRAQLLASEELPNYDEKKPVVRMTAVEIYSPDEWGRLLQYTRTNNKDVMLWLAFCGFAGCRSEEIMPSRRCEKRELRWENIRWNEGVIVVPAEVSKTNHRRIMPILPALRAWVYDLRKDRGPIVTGESWNVVRKLIRDAAKVGETLTFIKNGARHSYGSYRTADVKSAGQVALEMGNSENVVKRHYLYHVTPEDAQKWWAIMPEQGDSGTNLVQGS